MCFVCILYIVLYPNFISINCSNKLLDFGSYKRSPRA